MTIEDFKREILRLSSDYRDSVTELANELSEALKTGNSNPAAIPVASDSVHFILDFGHGGNHPETGVYMTPAILGKKYFFENANFEVREGVINRLMGQEVIKLFEANGIPYSVISHPYLDTPLATLATEANRITAEKAKQGIKTVLLSFHSNAFGNSARGNGVDAKGWSVWTTRGNTSSDKIAEKWYELQEKEFIGEIVFRKDISDGDRDWEENFYIIYYTHCPAVLVENLFFTNLDDAKKLVSSEYQRRCAIPVLRLAKWINENKKGLF